jgi:hypothetical protein
MGGWNLPQSKWANPFKATLVGGKDNALRLYEEHIRSSKELIQHLPELEGKVLGCW